MQCMALHPMRVIPIQNGRIVCAVWVERRFISFVLCIECKSRSNVTFRLFFVSVATLRALDCSCNLYVCFWSFFLLSFCMNLFSIYIPSLAILVATLSSDISGWMSNDSMHYKLLQCTERNAFRNKTSSQLYKCWTVIIHPFHKNLSTFQSCQRLINLIDRNCTWYLIIVNRIGRSTTGMHSIWLFMDSQRAFWTVNSINTVTFHF